MLNEKFVRCCESEINGLKTSLITFKKSKEKKINIQKIQYYSFNSKYCPKSEMPWWWFVLLSASCLEMWSFAYVRSNNYKLKIYCTTLTTVNYPLWVHVEKKRSRPKR